MTDINPTPTPPVATEASYLVTFTEKTDYSIRVLAASVLEAARKAKASYDAAGPEAFEPGFTEGVDWTVTDPDGAAHDLEDDEIEEDANEDLLDDTADDGSTEAAIDAGDGQ